jgi:hypothetical protein
LMTESVRVPDPDPVTVMLPAHVAVNETLALDEVVGVTVYFRLPHPVGGVDAVTDDHVPAKASMLVDPVGLVGDLSFFDSRSQPVVSAQDSTKRAAVVRSFIDLPYRRYDS